MEKPLFLGLDLGTTNIKAQIVEPDGRIVSTASAPVGIEYSADGAAEQDIEDIWAATVTAVAKAAASGRGGLVRAIGLSSQGGAIQILDDAERPIGRVIGWQDSRGGPWEEPVSERLGQEWFIRHTGYARAVSTIGQILRLRDQQGLPKDFRLGWVGDVVAGRLCGRRAHDATSLSEPCLLNPEEGDADAEVLALMGITRDQLPALLDVGQAAGGLLPGTARLMGLPAGIPVGPAVHDQYTAALGCGAVRPGDTMLGSGTAWVLVVVTDRIELHVGQTALIGRHPVPGLFGQMLSMVNGGGCLSWAARTLNLGEKNVEEFDALMRSVPVGSSGLRFRPHLSEIRGVSLLAGTAGRLDGLRLYHTPAHIVRALVEGLACELGRYLHMMERGGMHIARLVMCGKAATSEVTPQIIADTTGLVVDCALLPETSSLGAAILARKLTEPDIGLGRLSDAMKPPMRQVLPGREREEAAQRLEDYLASF
jgi:xylulokinase